MKRIAVYARVSTLDQNLDNQLLQLRAMAKQRGYTIVAEFIDHGISGAKSRRPGLDSMLKDARARKFDGVLVTAFDRLARSVKDFLMILDELEDLRIEFISAREAVDTSSAMGRLFVTILGSIAELERSLIAERIRLGMQRARVEGQKFGRRPLSVDRDAIARDRLSGLSLTTVARKHGVSRAMVVRLARDAQRQTARIGTEDAEA